VERGLKRERGVKPQATRYDLTALLVEFGKATLLGDVDEESQDITPLDVWLLARTPRA
jgi:hypothetical protein